LSLDGSSAFGRNTGGIGHDSSDDTVRGTWPIDPDPRVTNLRGRQHWYLFNGSPVGAEVAGHRIEADDARIAYLGIRRDSRGRPHPAGFAYAPATGERLDAPRPLPDPAVLDVDADSVRDVPLPGGRPILFRAGRPAGLYLLQDDLGTLGAWTGRAFTALGRLPANPLGSTLAAGPAGMAYTTAEALISMPLPQLGPHLDHAEARPPGLRFRSAPGWCGAALLALAERDGQVILCRGRAGSVALDLIETGHPASGGHFHGPWTNRLGDALWIESDGFIACRAGSDAIALTPWPAAFTPITAQAPWRDGVDMHHQLGVVEGRYHFATLAGKPVLRRLDGPRLAAGPVTYWGAECFTTPWQTASEALNLGIHAGSLLVPILAMARDTLLLAVAVESPRGDFLRGVPLDTPARGHVLHHAHGAGLRRLPVTLDVSAIGDAGALLHDGHLYLLSRSSGRCHALGLRAA
jgi:hypothetical protein